MKIANIHMSGNEHGQLVADTIYAELVDDAGEVVIKATLQYILSTIRIHEYKVDGVSVEWKESRGALCSTVRLEVSK